MEKTKQINFEAFEPLLRPLPATQGGGFRLTLDISEDQYDEIKELLNPALKNTPMKVEIKLSNQ